MENNITKTDFKKKYLKYKTKYVNLKHDMSGGWKSEEERVEVIAKLAELKKTFVDIREKRKDIYVYAEKLKNRSEFFRIYTEINKLLSLMKENGVSEEEVANLAWTNIKDKIEVERELEKAKKDLEELKKKFISLRQKSNEIYATGDSTSATYIQSQTDRNKAEDAFLEQEEKIRDLEWMIQSSGLTSDESRDLNTEKEAEWIRNDNAKRMSMPGYDPDDDLVFDRHFL
jgi:hypothetical protein